MPALGGVWIPADEAADGSRTSCDKFALGLWVLDDAGVVFPRIDLRETGAGLSVGGLECDKSMTHWGVG